MYNEPQKLEYLEDENNRFMDSTLEVAKRFFNASAVVEKQEGTDLSNFNREQVVKLLKKFNSGSKGYCKNICNIFSDYYMWCMENGYIDSSNYTNWYDNMYSSKIIDEVLPSSLIEDKFFLKDDVLKYLDMIPDPSDKLLLYAPFLGINGKGHEDLKYLKVDDLYSKRKAIQLHSGRIQEVDDLFIELLQKVDKETRYYADGRENYTIKKSKYASSIYVFKICEMSKENKVISNNTISRKMSVIKKHTGNKFISIPTLYQNGLINYIKEHYEKQGISLYKALFHQQTKKDYTYDSETEKVIEKFGSNKTVRMLRMELKDYIEYYM